MKKININNGVNSFPTVRLRRLRTTAAMRDLLQETRLSPKDLIAPIFVQEGLKNSKEVHRCQIFTASTVQTCF